MVCAATFRCNRVGISRLAGIDTSRGPACRHHMSPHARCKCQNHILFAYNCGNAAAMPSGIAAKKLPSLGAASLAGVALQHALTACQKGLAGASTTKSWSERGVLSRFHLQLPHRFPLPITRSTQADTSQGPSFPFSPAPATSSDSAAGVVLLHDGYGVQPLMRDGA